MTGIVIVAEMGGGKKACEKGVDVGFDGLVWVNRE